MGAVKIDIEKDERNLSVKYALNDKRGVRLLLRDRYHIANRRFLGDLAAADILIDLNSAIESAGLTERQAEALGYVYGYWQLTQEEAAQTMGIRQNTVSELLDIACERIAGVFERWNYGEINVVAAQPNETTAEGEND
ncbi:sigma factor-like helix-turn-helix DNA-binding protein [Paenibacillus sp. YN15]|uniref:sigma factor-like helix-turn-helix DNA-binding protein n=1 Tax=Paenibacillus sp. YN15 TaxID=1742774 RepID=UPI000DCC28E8|nr:sigma factor-like helix-turn-helix DNA-binding protein [Paenibacillus sp. YN15]RAU96826.1 RNA polymerase subunit sigma [Paenibacillus sp. YN15]